MKNDPNDWVLILSVCVVLGLILYSIGKFILGL